MQHRRQPSLRVDVGFGVAGDHFGRTGQDGQALRCVRPWMARSAAQTAVAPHSAMVVEEVCLEVGTAVGPSGREESVGEFVCNDVDSTGFDVGGQSFVVRRDARTPGMALTSTRPSTRERSMSADSNASMPPRE